MPVFPIRSCVPATLCGLKVFVPRTYRAAGLGTTPDRGRPENFVGGGRFGNMVAKVPL